MIRELCLYEVQTVVDIVLIWTLILFAILIRVHFTVVQLAGRLQQRKQASFADDTDFLFIFFCVVEFTQTLNPCTHLQENDSRIILLLNSCRRRHCVDLVPFVNLRVQFKLYN